MKISESIYTQSNRVKIKVCCHSQKEKDETWKYLKIRIGVAYVLLEAVHHPEVWACVHKPHQTTTWRRADVGSWSWEGPHGSPRVPEVEPFDTHHMNFSAFSLKGGHSLDSANEMWAEEGPYFKHWQSFEDENENLILVKNQWHLRAEWEQPWLYCFLGYRNRTMAMATIRPQKYCSPGRTTRSSKQKHRTPS